MSRIIVMNSAMMPNDGTYVCKYVDSETFKKAFHKAYEKSKSFESTIGYQETADLLTELLGVEVPMNRVNTALKSGDIMFVVRSTQRFDPDKKGLDHLSSVVFAIIKFK